MSTVAHARPCTLSRVTTSRETCPLRRTAAVRSLSTRRRCAPLRVAAATGGADRVTVEEREMDNGTVARRECLLGGIATALVGGALLGAPPRAFADDFITTASGKGTLLCFIAQLRLHKMANCNIIRTLIRAKGIGRSLSSSQRWNCSPGKWDCMRIFRLC
eukprot:9478180-Pyramimonas_sp.AAC.1